MRSNSFDIFKKNLVLDLMALTFILFLLVIFFWKAIFLKQVILPADILTFFSPWKYYVTSPSIWNVTLSDPIREFYPWKFFLIKSLKQGFFPLWNPYVLSGTPFVSNIQAALFYPLNFILFIFPFKQGYSYYIILHYFLGMVFMYFYGRNISLNRVASLIAASVFMFNSWTVNLSQQIPVLSVIIWLPLILLLIEKMVSRQKLVYGVLTGVFLSVSLLAGNIQFSYYIFLTAFLYFFFRLLWIWRQNKDFKLFAKLSGYFGLALFLSFALAAIQLLPTFEALDFIVRRGDPYQVILTGALKLKEVVTFLVPHYFGDPIREIRWVNVSVEASGYVGIFPLVLSGIALFFRRDKLSFFFAALAAFSLLLSFGTPLYKLLYSLPLGQSLRVPMRFLFLYVFSLAVLSGLGAQYLANFSKSLRKRGFFYFLTGVASGGGFLILLSFYLFVRYEAPLTYLARETGFFLLFLSASLVLILAFQAGRLKPPALKGLALGLILFDLFFYNINFLSYVSPKIVYFKTPSLEFLQEDKELFRITRFGQEKLFSPLSPNTAMVYGLADIQGSDVFILKRYAEFLNLIEDHGNQAYFNEIYNFNEPKSFNSNLLGLLNAKYILSSEEIPGLSYWKVYPVRNSISNGVYGKGNKDIKIYKNPNYLPRAFLVPHYKVIKGEEKVLEKIRDKNFDPHKTVILEKNPREASRPPEADGTTRPNNVKITAYKPNEIRLLVNSENKRFLVLSEIFYPGWEAEVNGEKGEVLRANYTFRALYLPAGKHQVRLVFRPKSFFLGRLITLTAAGVVIFYFLLIVTLSVAKGLRIDSSPSAQNDNKETLRGLVPRWRRKVGTGN